MARRDRPCRTARAHSRRPSSVECVVLAVVVFHESLARSPWELALQLAGAATAVTGIVLLGHCGVVVAEDRRAGFGPGSSGILGL